MPSRKSSEDWNSKCARALGDGVLGPALRVGLGCGGAEEAGERFGEWVDERGVLVLDGEPGGLGYEEIVLAGEGFAERLEGGGWWGFAEGF